MEDLDLSVAIVISWDTLMKYAINCTVDHPRMLMLLGLTLHVINEFNYLKRNIMSIFTIEQVSRHLHK